VVEVGTNQRNLTGLSTKAAIDAVITSTNQQCTEVCSNIVTTSEALPTHANCKRYRTLFKL
jgi:hypothetical protein